MRDDITYASTKTYTHATGLSCCFRQWRANSHCKFLHGYALEVKVAFTCTELDQNGWVMDFGDLDWLKKWLCDRFDHKTLVARDDPEIQAFRQLHSMRIIDMVEVPRTGCEAFAEQIFDYVRSNLTSVVQLLGVEVREHAANSAVVSRREMSFHERPRPENTPD
jgi:6-pyruvoyltetrahydropterin/6-carboxytetrahydropterin synthase